MRAFIQFLLDIIRNWPDGQKDVTALEMNKEPIKTPEKPTNEVPEPIKPDYVQLMAEGIRSFEGWYEGSRSWRNRNAGNIKGLDGKFLVFKTPEEGFEYLKDYIRRACTGRHKAYKPTMTLRDFFSVYAPDGNLIVTNYSNHVATHMGVYPSFKLSEVHS